MTLKNGDLITYIFEHNVWLTYASVSNAGIARIHGTVLKPREENLSWLRGHHVNDSDEVKAARVARALSL